MRVKSISVQDTLPVREFHADNLSDLVVIAGPNGVGKTRLLDGVLNHFRNLQGNNPRFIIEATSKDELSAWGKPLLDTSDSQDAERLRALLQRNRRRRNFTSSIVNYESNRSIQNIQRMDFQFEFPDPWEEDVSWDSSSYGLASRWQDTLHAIFKKIQSQKNSIANRAVQLRAEGRKEMRLRFEDPLTPFREAFERLLGPKTLDRADVQNQTLLYNEHGESRDVVSLSSGEREVLCITFDFILRRPTHCVVFFDEPELHLHPELLARLITTLRSVGESNQFIFVTHSSEVISSSLNDTIIFLTPPREQGGNQAVTLRTSDASTDILHRLGQSIGVVSLGKKVVLIEGQEASLDRRTYSDILGSACPGLVLLPSGGKGHLSAFDKVASDILDQTLWGIRFFMLADRDASPKGTDNAHFRVLSRYHLENYFLDAEILASCFAEMESAESWLRSPEEVATKLRELAREGLGHAAALVAAKRLRDSVGNIDVMPKGIGGYDRSQLAQAFIDNGRIEVNRVLTYLDPTAIEATVLEVYRTLDGLLDAPTDDWKTEFPGKPIFRRFCNAAGMRPGRMQSLYLSKASIAANDPFAEIRSIFDDFARF